MARPVRASAPRPDRVAVWVDSTNGTVPTSMNAAACTPASRDGTSEARRLSRIGPRRAAELVDRDGPSPRCADSCGSSRLHLGGTVDDVCGDAAADGAAMVTLLVVVVEVFGEVALEAGEADSAGSGRRRVPGIFEDRGGGLRRGRWFAGSRRGSVPGGRRAGRASLGRSRERNSPPLSVRTRSSRQPAWASSAQTWRASFEVWAPLRLPRGQLTSSALANEEATSIALSCQTAPFVPERRPTRKRSIPTNSPGRSASTWRSGSR